MQIRHEAQEAGVGDADEAVHVDAAVAVAGVVVVAEVGGGAAPRYFWATEKKLGWERGTFEHIVRKIIILNIMLLLVVVAEEANSHVSSPFR